LVFLKVWNGLGRDRLAAGVRSAALSIQLRQAATQSIFVAVRPLAACQ
jgi:hypothetical protein